MTPNLLTAEQLAAIQKSWDEAELRYYPFGREASEKRYPEHERIGKLLAHVDALREKIEHDSRRMQRLATALGCDPMEVERRVVALVTAIKLLEDLRESAERLSDAVPPDAVHEGIYADIDEMAADACPLAVAVLNVIGNDEQIKLPVQSPRITPLAPRKFEFDDDD